MKPVRNVFGKTYKGEGVIARNIWNFLPAKIKKLLIFSGQNIKKNMNR